VVSNGEKSLALPRTPDLEDRSLSAVHSYPSYLEAVSSVRNLRTRHAMVTRDKPYTGRKIGVQFPAGTGTFFSSPRPDRLWSPASLLSDGYRGSFPGGEADHSPPSSAEVKNTRSFTSIAWYMVKHSHNFSFFLQYRLVSPPPRPLRSHWNIGPQQLYNCWGFYSG
jgi:hypothetical protein